MPLLSLHTPVGDLSVAEHDGAIVSVDWGWGSTQDETALLGVLVALFSFGLFLLVFFLMLLIPKSAGRPQVDQPLPEFDVLFADGKRYAPLAMAHGGPVLLVFFRGFW